MDGIAVWLEGSIHHPAVVIPVCVVIVFLWRALHFHLRSRFLGKVEERWHEYMRAEDRTYENPTVRWLEERTRKVKSLVVEAGTAPPGFTVMRPVGYNHVQGGTLDPLDNWLARDREVTPRVSGALIRAQGHYKDERNRNLNPLGWIEQLVFLPRNLISSVDPRIPKWVKDVVQIVYWITVSAVTVYEVATRANP
jgi:hypothetical protein